MRVLRATAAALALAGCAGPATQRPAHGSFDARFRAEVWERTLTTVTSRGYELGFEDAALGVLVTKERESHAPCGETTCLSRDVVHLRLENGHLVVDVSRTLWDTTLRTWSPPSDARAIAAIEEDQVSLVREISDGSAELRPSRKGEPCYATPECARGLACERRHCGAAARH